MPGSGGSSTVGGRQNAGAATGRGGVDTDDRGGKERGSTTGTGSAAAAAGILVGTAGGASRADGGNGVRVGVDNGGVAADVAGGSSVTASCLNAREGAPRRGGSVTGPRGGGDVHAAGVGAAGAGDGWGVAAIASAAATAAGAAAAGAATGGRPALAGVPHPRTCDFTLDSHM